MTTRDQHSVAITIEKDDSSSHKNSILNNKPTKNSSVVGFKNIIIYVLVFTNLLLCSKLFSIWSRASTVPASPEQGFVKFAEEPEHEGEDASMPEFWIKMGLILFLVLIGGVFAGTQFQTV